MDSELLFDEQVAALYRKAFAQLHPQLVVNLPRSRGSSGSVVTSQLVYLPETALKDLMETSTGSECGRIGSYQHALVSVHDASILQAVLVASLFPSA